MTRKIKVGIVGCGTIGGQIAAACLKDMKKAMELAAICDIDEEKAGSLRKALKSRVPVVNLDELIKKSDLIVEAASAVVPADLLKKVIERKKSILIMSTGGLLGREELLEKASKAGTKVFIPSGALCGIDGLKAASIGRIDSVRLTTYKGPKGLAGAPYLKRNKIDVMAIKNEKTIFDGNAYDAAKGFPKNINVCAILSLAGIGARRTRVRIVVSPRSKKNIHEVEVKGEFGVIRTRTENLVSKTNIKTSLLAVFSAIAAMREAAGSVRIGI